MTTANPNDIRHKFNIVLNEDASVFFSDDEGYAKHRQPCVYYTTAINCRRGLAFVQKCKENVTNAICGYTLSYHLVTEITQRKYMLQCERRLLNYLLLPFF